MLHKLEKQRPERQEERKIPIRWNESRLIHIQISQTKLDWTKRNEECMKLDSAARVLNSFNEIWFDDTKTDWAIRHSTHCNKNSIFDVDYASLFYPKIAVIIHSLSKDVNLLSKKRQSTIMVTIFWDFLMFDQIILSQLKRRVIFSYKHGIYELPYELPNDLRLKISGN